MGIIFNEIVINKTVFRMVLLSFIDGKYFNLNSAIIFVFVFLKTYQYFNFANETFLHTLCS